MAFTSTTNGIVSEPNKDINTSQLTSDQLNKPTVAVFCGASSGTSPAHMAAAHALAEVLHKRGLNLVYGGGTVGLMGELARTLVSLSGPESVHGIIPRKLLGLEAKNNVDARVYGKTTIVDTMHARKQMMVREVVAGGKGGGFVALSGGYGTLEELMEMTTWNMLGIHSMPIVVFNVKGYFDGLLRWIGEAVEAGFVKESNRNIMIEAQTADEVAEKIRAYKAADGRLELDWDEV